HQKSPYEAFFGFKMHGVYNTPGETIAIQDINNNQATFVVYAMQCSSKKLAFESGDKVTIAYDHNNNQKIRKQKLEQTSNATEKVISIYNNNKTVRVEVD
ncbi:3597_t:CDS:2, partial [Racocetra fulgida]